MIGPLFDLFGLLAATLLVVALLIIPGLSAASTAKNLGAIVLALTLLLAWVLVLRSHLTKGPE